MCIFAGDSKGIEINNKQFKADGQQLESGRKYNENHKL